MPVLRVTDCHEVCQSQYPGAFKAYTETALPSHRRSAVCRSTKLTTSVTNDVSHRGWRSASCTVDVDWQMVWVQLVVRARDEHYRDGQLNGVLLCGFTLTVECGYADCLSWGRVGS